MPIIAMIFGKPDFHALMFTINDAVFRYGAFIAVITFIAIAAAVFFFVVKPMDYSRPRRRASLRRFRTKSGATGAAAALSTLSCEADSERGGSRRLAPVSAGPNWIATNQRRSSPPTTWLRFRQEEPEMSKLSRSSF
jgi:hypothetical protein